MTGSTLNYTGLQANQLRTLAPPYLVLYKVTVMTGKGGEYKISGGVLTPEHAPPGYTPGGAHA